MLVKYPKKLRQILILDLTSIGTSSISARQSNKAVLGIRVTVSELQTVRLLAILYSFNTHPIFNYFLAFL